MASDRLYAPGKPLSCAECSARGIVVCSHEDTKRTQQETGTQTHELKCWPEHFERVRVGAKRFELRREDRGFSPDDTLMLCEFDPATQRYSGRRLTVQVLSVLDVHEGLRPGFVVLALGNVCSTWRIPQSAANDLREVPRG